VYVVCILCKLFWRWHCQLTRSSDFQSCGRGFEPLPVLSTLLLRQPFIHVEYMCVYLGMGMHTQRKHDYKEVADQIGLKCIHVETIFLDRPNNFLDRPNTFIHIHTNTCRHLQIHIQIRIRISAPHTHTHTNTPKHMHICTHTHTHTHTLCADSQCGGAQVCIGFW
jgi:hypothetical protein